MSMKRLLVTVIILSLLAGLTTMQNNVSASDIDNTVEISGRVFIDNNFDSKLNEKDKVLSDIEIEIYVQREIINEEGNTISSYEKETSVYTNKDGSYNLVIDFDKNYILNMSAQSIEKIKYEAVKKTVIIKDGLIYLSTDMYFQEKIEKEKLPLNEFLKDYETDTFSKIELAYENGYIDYDTKIKYFVKAIKKEEPEVYKSTIKAKCGTIVVEEILEYIKENKLDNVIVAEAIEAEITNWLDLDIFNNEWHSYETNHFEIRYLDDGSSDHKITNLSKTNGDPNEYDCIETLGSYCETVYQSLISILGFRRPFEDNISATEEKLELYIADGAFMGLTVYPRDTGGNSLIIQSEDMDDYGYSEECLPARCTAFIIDSDYFNGGNATTIKSIISHEFFHGVHFAYNSEMPDNWFCESLCNYMKLACFPNDCDYSTNEAGYYSTPTDILHSGGTGCAFISYLCDELDGFYTVLDMLNLMSYDGEEAEPPELTYDEEQSLELINRVIVDETVSDTLEDIFLDFMVDTNLSISNKFTINSYPHYGGYLAYPLNIFNHKYSATNTYTNHSLMVVFDGYDSPNWGLEVYKSSNLNDSESYTSIVNSNPNKLYTFEISGFGTLYPDVIISTSNLQYMYPGERVYSIDAYELCPSSGHSWVVALDCESRTCSNCSWIDLNGPFHSPGTWGVEPGDEPNCVETGLEKQYCTRCSELLQTNVLPTNSDHLLGTLHVCTTAYCDTTGYKHQHCLRAYCSYTTNPVPYYDPNNHTWPSSWTIIDQPTCYETGTEVKKCTRCQDVLDTRSIPATGNHVYNGTQVIIYPETCTTSGKTKIYCSTSGCSSYTYIYPPATGHINTTLTVFSIDKTYSTCPYTRYTYDERCDACHEWMENYSYTNVYTGHVMGSWYFWYDYWDDMIFDYVNVYKKDCSICNYYQTYED